MKKAFIILGLIMVISGILSIFQFRERKEIIDSMPVLLEPEAVVVVTDAPASSGAAAESVPVFDGSCG